MNEFKKLPLYGRVLIVAFAALVVVELAVSLVEPLGGDEPGKSVGSAYSTKPEGLAAYAELLASAGHRITRERRPIDQVGLAGNVTLVVAGVALTDDEMAAAANFVQAGGRLVAAGSQTTGALRRIVDDAIRWKPAVAVEPTIVVAVPETDGVEHVDGMSGAWRKTGGALPIDTHATIALANVGPGRVVMLAGTAPLQNQWLTKADNAAFALAAAGGKERPVVFAEAGHVGGSGTGVAAVPNRWKWALVAGGIAAVLAMWSAGRRFGPPEEEGRDLPPPRRAYVDALAVTMAKARQPDASMAPLRRAARERLMRRAALSPDADDAMLRKAAADLGLEPDEIAALFGGAVQTDEQALAVGRAMARLGGPRW